MKIKHIILIVSLFVLVAWAKAADPELTFSFTTSNINGESYSPSHVFAVWIEDGNGTFVNTLMVYARERIGYLEKFNGSSGGYKVDAITGETLHAHTSHTATWNMKDFLTDVVGNGDYKLCFEMSSGGHGDYNPYYEIPFTLDGQSFILTPTDKTYLKSMTLSYSNGVTAGVNDIHESQKIQIFPNPVTSSSKIKVEGLPKGKYHLEMYTMKGQVISQSIKTVSSDSEEWSLPISTSMLQNQMYILRVFNETEEYQLSFIYKSTGK